jgi:hypothetical protein
VAVQGALGGLVTPLRGQHEVSRRRCGSTRLQLDAGCVRETAVGQVPIKLLHRAVLEVLTGTFVVSEVTCGQGYTTDAVQSASCLSLTTIRVDQFRTTFLVCLFITLQLCSSIYSKHYEFPTKPERL